MDSKKVKARQKELTKIFEKLPDNKKALLNPTIETIAFMDIQCKELEEIISSGLANTPDKQLYSTMVKSRDLLMKRLLAELPAEEVEEVDEFDKY